ncbi:MAG: hypothetical protein JXC85_02560 [Candidatus Aenigmarchaeota archaeon]|nr:hypothetical protein [Candidatus Aenigmarchaeota archaeon]
MPQKTTRIKTVKPTKKEPSAKELEQLYWKHGLSTRKIAANFGVSQKPVLRLMKNYEIPRRDRIEAVIRGCRKYNKNPFSGNINEKAYLLGLAFADLRVRKHGYQIDIGVSTTHPSFSFLFKKLFRKYAPIRENPYYNKWTKQHCWRLEAQLHPSFDFLLSPKLVPKWIIENEVAFLNFLAGYSDGEGIISICRNSKRCVSFVFAISSEDRNILFSIFQGLKNLGFHPTFRVLRSAGDMNEFRGKQLVYKKDHLMVRLKRRADVLRLLKILPIRHPEKIKKRKLMFELGDRIYITDVMDSWLKLKDEIKSNVNRYVSEAAFELLDR